MYACSYVLNNEKDMNEILKKAAKEIECEEIQKQLKKLGSILTNVKSMCRESLLSIVNATEKGKKFVNTPQEFSRV